MDYWLPRATGCWKAHGRWEGKGLTDDRWYFLEGSDRNLLKIIHGDSCTSSADILTTLNYILSPGELYGMNYVFMEPSLNL